MRRQSFDKKYWYVRPCTRKEEDVSLKLGSNDTAFERGGGES